MTQTTTAQQAIDQSIAKDSISHIPYCAEARADLVLACDDSTEASDTIEEFWGVDEDGASWRVHLHREGRELRGNESRNDA